MRSGQAGKYGIGLERAVLDKAQSAVKRPSRALVILVPRRECGCCPLPSTPDALQSVENILCGERWQLSVGNRDDPFTPLLQPHRSRSNLDLEASVCCPDFQRLTRLEAERLT